MSDVLRIVQAAMATTVFLAAAWGWGRSAALVLGLRSAPTATWPGETALGIASWVAIGGVLNLVAAARREALWAILVLGVAQAVYHTRAYLTSLVLRAMGRWRTRRAHSTPPRAQVRWVNYLPDAVVAAMALFLAFAIYPTTVYNAHDDFHIYLKRPERLLQLGTLAGDVLDPIGRDSLGGQALLQALWSGHLSTAHIAACDGMVFAVFAAILVIALGRRTGAGPWLSALAVSLLFIVPPQSVNVSSLFTGTALAVAIAASSELVSGASLASSTPGEGNAAIQKNGALEQVRRSLPMALLAAALLTLKTTQWPFAASFVGLHCVALGAQRRNFGASLRHMATLACLVGTALIPWAAAYPHQYGFAAQHDATRADAQVDAAANAEDQSNLVLRNNDAPWVPDAAGRGLNRHYLSSESLNWGGSPLAYSLLLIVVLLMAFVGGYLMWAVPGHHWPPALAPATCLCASTIIGFVFLANLFAPHDTIRYTIPWLLAALPVAVITFGLLARRHLAEHAAFRRSRRARKPSVSLPIGSTAWAYTAGAALVLGSAVSVLGLGSASATRFQRLAHGIPLAYPVHDNYAAGCAAALGPDGRERIRQAQATVPAGAVLMAYVATPFHLDFARNTILAGSDGGFNQVLTGIASRNAADTLRAFFVRHKVQYVVWQRRGFGVKPDSKLRSYLTPGNPNHNLGKTVLATRTALAQLLTQARVIYSDQELIVFDVGDA